MVQRTLTKDAVLTDGLGKKYRSFWALKDCNITVPRGSVSALVGPNGAGKTTLLKLLISLSRPSAGSCQVLGKNPEQTEDFLAEVGYLAQEIPLYKQFNAGDHVAMGAHLNRHYDAELATKRLEDLGIPFDRPVGKLSGGQRAQVALALALAKKPKLLLLDEPVAALDPLARIDFLKSLAKAVADAEGDLTVVMSSHLLADLERVCDHLIILASGETQLCDDIDNVLKSHKVLVGPKRETAEAEQNYTVIQETHAPRQSTLLVCLNDGQKIHGSYWQVHDADIEEIVLAYMGKSKLKAADKTAKGGKQ
ncbi:MAG: ATP-binding cassette domain-containing protein [Candidatus Saccharimonadales bacterium]